jgi:hypothetical protein
VGLSAGVLLAALFAFYSVRLAWVARHQRHLHQQRRHALWIPQIAMALGTVVLLVALVDEWVLELRGPSARSRKRGGPAQ